MDFGQVHQYFEATRLYIINWSSSFREKILIKSDRRSYFAIFLLVVFPFSFLKFVQ